ncbi:MAG: hypothetical protein LBU72_07340 [Burkholderiaceae bacterium]|jgi:hypothetical protein|nr:hypothetical protein [Burkholderiaceae bacterium]
MSADSAAAPTAVSSVDLPDDFAVLLAGAAAARLVADWLPNGVAARLVLD